MNQRDGNETTACVSVCACACACVIMRVRLNSLYACSQSNAHARIHVRSNLHIFSFCVTSQTHNECDSERGDDLGLALESDHDNLLLSSSSHLLTEER